MIESKNKIKIGDIELKHGIMLAPLAGVSDSIFRRICKSFGAEYTVSEMISAKALCYEQLSKGQKSIDNVRTAPIAHITKDELPIAIQLFGSEPEYIARAAEMLVKCNYNGCKSETSPTAIDINMGCPVNKVVSNGEGSALMKTPFLCGEIVSAVKKAVDIPVTVKIRTGWDDSSVNAVEIAKICEANGADAICVHGRTRMKMYAPGVDKKTIANVKNAVKIPVIANGDIFNAQDVAEMFNDTGCDGVMIARGALGNPWIFKEIISYFECVEYIPPTNEERIMMAINHAEAMLSAKGTERIAEARKHVAWYIKGIPGAAAARNKIMTTESFSEVKDLLISLI